MTLRFAMVHDQSSILRSVKHIDCAGRIGEASSTESQAAMRRSHDPEEV